jgi:hypothetical protein
MVFLWCIGGKGCPADLILKFGGPITFDSRSGVSSLVKLVFGFGFVLFRWIGGREVVAAAGSFG